MRHSAYTLAAAAALFYGASALAQQPISGPPVTINSCSPELESTGNSPSVLNIPVSSTSQGIKIEFVNESSKVANLINFDVNSNGEQFVIRDVGTFSPGVSITHKYRNGAGQAFVLPSFIAPKIACQVASVRFTDGSYWTKGQTPAQSTPAPNAHPSALRVFPTSIALDSSTESDLFLVTSPDRVTAFKESDNCTGVAAVSVAATGESTATYSVKPLAAGSCTATITDETGSTLSVPIVVR